MAGLYKHHQHQALTRKTHLVIHIDLAPRNIIQLPLQQFSLQRLEMIDEELPLDMIVFMQDDPRADPAKGRDMRLEVLVNILKGYLLAAEDILPDLGNAKTALVIGPFFAIQLDDMRIDEHLLDPRPIRVLVLLV